MKQQTVPGARRLREVLARHGVTPKKSLGQNFVVDPNTIRKIVELAEVSNDDRVLEIGAGAGSLTLGLAAVALQVTAVEVDPRLLPVLMDTLGPVENVKLVAGDALKLPLDSFEAGALVANLPYNVATPLVLRVLREAPDVERLTVMTQREPGDRLSAGPGSKAYGHVSLMVEYFGQARVVSSVSRRAFYPVPNVDSVIVRIDRKQEALPEHREWLFAVIRAGFSQRRKTLRNALASVAGVDAAEAAIAATGIGATARAEQLGLEDFLALSQALLAHRPDA
ncbi:MAG: rRNA (adenine1518-N6/adenine1519-N6)-dimethyltransferase [Actinomycetota bacterium]|jgi:16S rRNA (adenine1518-N6/adenine1519-N6)-dimethyltransferase|nr:rRNA (adenine1518-N6/adenine1519-N6)-dimethyltransferase [Actinomycetota bacterium]